MKPLTGAQRVAALRARRAAEGLVEVRGVFLTIELHQALKRYARSIAPLPDSPSPSPSPSSLEF
jgi:hypothetical protein